MIRTVLSRLLRSVPLLLAASLLAFALADGGKVASASAGTSPERYARFMIAVAQGDFGVSRAGRPVAELLGERLPATADVLALAMALAILLGLPAGLLAAVFTRSPLLRRIGRLAHVGVALPVVCLGSLLLVPLAVVGVAPPNYGSGRLALVLPTLTVAMLPAAVLFRQARRGLAAALDHGAIRFARARGLSTEAVFGHAVPNALLPMVAAAARHAGTLLAGCVVAETVFGWPGLGQLLARSASEGDAPVLAAMVLLLVCVMLTLDILAFALSVALDPRQRPARAASVAVAQ